MFQKKSAGRIQLFSLVLFSFVYCFESLVAWSADDNKVVLLATTTSTENSGLLEYLLPEFEKSTGYSVRTISAGTGKALKMGEAGDVDVLLVHAKESELAFIKAGYGVERREIMFNDFVVVGPADDPASIHSSLDVGDSFRKIASNEAGFVSRGDDSGTHKKELSIWQSTGIKPYGVWYREIGQGMGKALQIAEELQAYTLTDRGTWIFAQGSSSLNILFEGDEQLMNQYSVILVNPERHSVNYKGAKAFSDWMISQTGQQLIDIYRIRGQQLFHANAN